MNPFLPTTARQGIARPTIAKKAMWFSAILVGLVACSEDSSDTSTSTPPTTPPTTTPPTTTPPVSQSVSGSVSAPSGTIANTRQSTFFSLLFPPAYAAVTGLQPAPNANVELIRVDDKGVQIGDVLASTQTSSTGAYSLTLPTGVSLAGNLVVRVYGTTTHMSAIAIAEEVHITPTSHYVYQSLIDSDLVMANITASHVVTLSGVIDQLPLNAGIDLASTQEVLDTIAGYQVQQETTTLMTTQGDSAVLVGDWHNAIFKVGLHDTDDGNSGSFSTSINISQHSVTAANATTASVSLNAYTSNSGSHQYSSASSTLDTTNQSVTSSSDTFSVEVRNNGTLVKRTTFLDKLDDVATPGPLYGLRYQPNTFVLESGGSDDVKVGINHNYGIRYGTIDTNTDGTFDALDVNNKLGDEPNLTFDLLMKSGSELSSSILAGNVGMVSVEQLLDSTNSSTKISTRVNEILFSAGGTSVTSNVEHDQLIRTPSALSFSNPPETSLTSGIFSVSSDGSLTLIENGITSTGFVSSAGSIFVTKDVASDATSYRQQISLGVKIGGSTVPLMTGAKYQLYPLEIGYSGTEAQITTFALPGTLTFTSESDANLAGQSYGVKKDTDLGQVASANDALATTPMTFGFQGVSHITITADDGTHLQVLDGFIADDGSRMVLTLKDQNNIGTADAYYGLGFVLAVKVN